MFKPDDLIWYVSYGSNMCRDRFMTYINGGSAVGSSLKSPGCTDKTLPKGDKRVTVNYKLWYGGTTFAWPSGGVAFLSKKPGRTPGRAYLITYAQFEEIVQQENWKLHLPLEGLFEKKQIDLPLPKYIRVVLLGEDKGIPLITFTNAKQFPINPPCKEYKAMIDEGRKEIKNLTLLKYKTV